MRRLRSFLLITLAIVLVVAGARVTYRALGGLVNRRVYEPRNRSEVSARPAERFYVSPAGNDAMGGTSPEQAWRTIARVNGMEFAPGDSILFEGGGRFEGTLLFNEDDVGTPARPITITSYGTGRATIQSGGDDGIRADNTGGFRIENLNVVGSGPEINQGDGISFVNDLVGDVKIDFVRIDQVEASGYGQHGIRIEGNNRKSGYRDVRITNVVARDNQVAGIYVYGEFSRFGSRYAHENVYVGHSRAFNNSGISGREIENTGSGIVVSDVDGAVIEHSVAYNNGWKSESDEGGPVGIWAWDSTRVTIQFNESYANRTAGIHDGGGFDLDGGVTHSVMQYNYSHDNDGAGYLVCQFSWARPFHHNVVRYNISQNDGRRNGLGGIFVFSQAENRRRIEKTDIYNNTISMTPPASGIPAPVVIDPYSVTSDVHFWSNIFRVAGGLSVLRVEEGQKGLLFQGNSYFVSGAPFEIRWFGQTYRSLEEWRAASGQEQLQGRPVGMSADPSLVLPEPATAVNDTTALSTLRAFRLRNNSPLIDTSLDLRSLFGIDLGPHDFFGTQIPQGKGVDVGAHEYWELAPAPRGTQVRPSR